MYRREKKRGSTKRPTAQMSLRLPIDLLARLKEEAEAERRSRSQIIEFAVEEWLNNRRQAG